MKKIFVFADFDWLKEMELIGELSYESLRGSDSYGFKFDDTWLKKHGAIFLSEDLNNYPGQQYTQPGKDIFGCFSDALPDRWGRTLLNRREQILAGEEKRPVRRLSSFDYLLGIDDYSRMGGFRFKESMDGDFINVSDTLRIPPLTDIRQLIEASREIEKSEEENQLPDKKWIIQLVHPGSSLGGARPKASIIDVDKVLYIAKFPSRKDDYDTALWEHFCHLLAIQVGIDAAVTQVISTNDKYHTLLSRRFDRTEDGERIHFASAMTLLGLDDGDNAATGHGYLDIVDFILQNCTNVEENLKELYRRVAFNICIGNSDDHFRNHGFLLTAKGWTFSPAYDMNPTLSEYQSLLINSSTNKADLNILLDACEEYMLSRKVAELIISEVIEVVKNWRVLATKLGISKREMEMFSSVFNSRILNNT
ncbi:type II toxin-antitoxin system HipA family toxin [Parabacteroides faecis]|uniref:type II toxin-antitoxin system HipA family toxin n=1 Tax=Parabacteroides TaxID=375288 RepID=UPI000F0043F3|nr:MULTISPECIES: type II toxin-antitoxin system HipA family toxin [Parabacteroides]MBC8618526.1 type II toxin-antitoxin system HipA family toxin [Parabacteroides faecis]RHR94768.1 type II toxin-antitoxin system HipA family toxin [Parabacteroides sp. AF14-59]